MEARYLGATVETRAYGDASSAASLILACGTPGHRFATSNTVCLVHDVSVEVDADSIMSANDAYEMLTSTLASKQIYAELMAGHTGKTPHEILSDMEHRIVLAGTDLKKYNIVDKVLPAFPAPPKRAKTVKKIKKPKRRKKKK
jgi:ATP-dependent Clp protease protease subunit